MSEKIYVKHNLGNFQQPYIYQQPGNSQVLTTGNTRGVLEIAFTGSVW